MNAYLYWICLLLFISCQPSPVQTDHTKATPPVIFPDYADVVFPANIAPPNFCIEEEGDAYYVVIGTEQEHFYSHKSKSNKVVIPEKAWHKLLKQQAGQDFFIRISVLQAGKWTQYADIKNSISTQKIDPFLSYRLLYPGYERWSDMGIYQRNLSNFEETVICDNKQQPDQCMNCHTSYKNDPDKFFYHIRGEKGGTLFREGNKTIKRDINHPRTNNSATYASWHPDGRYIVFSTNEVQQFFHATGKKMIEVADLDSDLILYDRTTDSVITPEHIGQIDQMETFPAWSPDGKWLYFCRAEKPTSHAEIEHIYYSLYRTAFGAENRLFDQPELICNLSNHSEAVQSHQSISFPRVSPDGNYLLFTGLNYGNFSIWHPESELYLLDLRNNKLRLMAEMNSPDVESYHTWSSDGAWIVVSSKRIDGLWAHPYFAQFDTQSGQATKPFLVPQKDPSFYRTFLKTFNLPEFQIGKIK